MALDRYVKLSRNLWGQAWFRRGGADVRQLYIYLVDNPVDTLIGVVPLDHDKIGFDLQMDPIAIDQAIGYLVAHGKVEVEGEYIRVVNYTDYQGYRGAKTGAAAVAEAEKCSAKCPTLIEAWKTENLDTVSEAKNTVSSAQNTVSKTLDTVSENQDTVSKKTDTVSLHYITLHNNTEHNITEQIPSAETAGAVPAPQKVSKRIKPEQPSYEDELKRLPPECLPAWQKFEAMVSSHNKTKEVSPNRMRDLLADILNRCDGLPPGAITHGLLQACQGGDDHRGVAKARYVSTCAANWRASPMPAQAVNHDEPDLPTADEALREREVRINPALLDPSLLEEPSDVPVQ